MENGATLHVVMMPWLAMGHLLPFLELSKRLARKGHRVSFLTTPRNAQRLLPNIPSNLSRLITLVETPLANDGTLPSDIEATVDLTSEDLRLKLNSTYNATFRPELSAFLRRTPADSVVYDTAAFWAPRVAADHGASCAVLGLFNAAFFCFLGPPSGFRGSFNSRTLPEHFTVSPEWVPFPTTVAYRLHEVRELFKTAHDPDFGAQLATAITDCPFVAIRSCVELEPEWLELLVELYEKPVVPVGLLPPLMTTESSTTWAGTHAWLDEQEVGSVVYVAFGSEVKLTVSQVGEIALGLERSGLPFLWALMADGLPDGFEARMEGRGVVCKGWVPQVRFLAHRAVGGFLTHGGWNSVVEGLSAGAALVMLPLLFDQGPNARLMVEKGVAVEVARDEDDGSFTGDGIARSLRFAMVDEEGEGLREKVKEWKPIFGDEELQGRYVEQFVKHLGHHKKQIALAGAF